MPTTPLPENASLEHLKGQAKLVRDLIRSGDDGALSMIDEFHPRFDAADLGDAERASFKLTDAQLIIARLYGCASWRALRAHLDVVTAWSFTPAAELADTAGEDESFVQLACLNYAEKGPSPADRIARAHRLLAADPSLATGSIEALTTVGDHGGLADLLDERPDAIDARCGPNDWPPLLYATYSRIDADEPAWSAVNTVRLLLERGADPNAGFLWRGLVPPFTALTGAFGRGESHQALHPDRLAIARLLLEAGADPNDGQGLYNNGIGGQDHDDPSHLELLLEFGLGSPQEGPWYERLGTQLGDPAELLEHELEAAALRGRPRVLRLLIDHGLDLDRPVGRSRKTPVRLAAERGHQEVLDLLAEAGVDTDLEPSERFLAHIRSSDDRALRALVETETGLVEVLLAEQPDAIKAVGAEGAAVLATLIGLGFDIDTRTNGSGTTALHAAVQGDDVPLARLLVDNGADPDVVDGHIGATPLGWAEHFGHEQVAAFLRPLTSDPADDDDNGGDG